MSKENFVHGEVVRLKSGGPRMVVAEKFFTFSDKLTCQWFTEDGQLHSANFEHGVLEKDVTT